MFRVIISPILRSTSLRYNAPTMLQHCRCIIAQASAPEDGRNYHPKHVELIEIINKIIIVASSRLFTLLYQ